MPLADTEHNRKLANRWMGKLPREQFEYLLLLTNQATERGKRQALGSRAMLKEQVQNAIENMPYRDFEVWANPEDPDDEVMRQQTLREFYEGTWQGDHADEVFDAVAEVVVELLFREKAVK